MIQQKGRAFLLTLKYDDTAISSDEIRVIFSRLFDNFVFQLERGEQKTIKNPSGFLHWQAFVKLPYKSSPKTVIGIKKILVSENSFFRNCHIEICNDERSSAIYASKNHTAISNSRIWSSEQFRKKIENKFNKVNKVNKVNNNSIFTTMGEYYDAHSSNTREWFTTFSEHKYWFRKNTRFLDECIRSHEFLLSELKKNSKKLCIYITGATGSGKTALTTFFDNVFSASENTFWSDGITFTHRLLAFDDCNIPSVNEFLRMSNRGSNYIFNVKNGSVRSNISVILVLNNLPISDFFKFYQLHDSVKSAILRRFDGHIYSFPAVDSSTDLYDFQTFMKDKTRREVYNLINDWLKNES